ncbi:hypothetical protein NC651_016154 [Populus alba x Populus x berolinensis]|nr:hypothetical protein NC651_016154 [Populus alba x Populus x berolinensis]
MFNLKKESLRIEPGRGDIQGAIFVTFTFDATVAGKVFSVHLFNSSTGYSDLLKELVLRKNRSLGLLKTSNLVLEIGIVHKIDEMMNLGWNV